MNWAEQKYAPLSTLDKTDVQATLCELTVATILSSIQNLNLEPSKIIVCGGGRLNTHLMNRLKQKSNCPIMTSDDYSINGDYIEASAFAWLSYKNLIGMPANTPLVTGASDNRVLGTAFKSD